MNKLIKILILIVCIGSLTSCMTEKKCYTRFPQQVITKDSIVFKDRLVEVFIHDTTFIKADTVINTDTVYHKNGLIWSDKVYNETDLAEAWAQVQDNILVLELIQKDSAIAKLLKENVIVKEKEVYKTETLIKKVWEVHWYDKIFRIIGGAVLLIILGGVIILGIKGKFGFIFKLFK